MKRYGFGRARTSSEPELIARVPTLLFIIIIWCRKEGFLFEFAAKEKLEIVRSYHQIGCIGGSW